MCEKPGASLLQAPWRELLEASVRKKSKDSWEAWLHLGTMRYAAGDCQAAREAWEKSLAIAPSAWALRNLAVVAKYEDRQQESAGLYLQAVKLAPASLQLAIECFAELLQAGRPAEVIAMVAKAPPAVAKGGRVRFLQARAALATGDWRTVRKILTNLEVGDIREGDNAITELWFQMNEQRLAEEEWGEIDDALRERAPPRLPAAAAPRLPHVPAEGPEPLDAQARPHPVIETWKVPPWPPIRTRLRGSGGGARAWPLSKGRKNRVKQFF